MNRANCVLTKKAFADDFVKRVSLTSLYVLFLVLTFNAKNASGQYAFENGYNGGAPYYENDVVNLSSGQFIDGGQFSSGQFYEGSIQNFDDMGTGTFVVPNGYNYDVNTVTSDGYSFSTQLGAPQFDDGGQYQNFTTPNGEQLRIIGDVSGAIPIGNSQYDSIPVLESNQFPKGRELPELKVPQNERELAIRIDALLERFSHATFSIQQATPGRLLRYSLIGGANQTCLAPQSATAGDAVDAAAPGELQPIFTLGALCWNFSCAGRRLFRIVGDKPTPTVGYGFQTYRGEFLAALAYARIDRNYELSVDGKRFHVQDLIDAEKRACCSQADLTTLAVALAHYSQDADEVWINELGERWSLAKILECEARRPIDWDTASSIRKLTALSYLLARLKQSANLGDARFAGLLQRVETFLVAMKQRAQILVKNGALSDVLFFNPNVKLETPYMTLYVNGKILLWLSFVSSAEEMKTSDALRVHSQLCALVDQLFNSLDNLDVLSPIDEETLATAMLTLSRFRKYVDVPVAPSAQGAPTPPTQAPSNDARNDESAADFAD